MWAATSAMTVPDTDITVQQTSTSWSSEWSWAATGNQMNAAKTVFTAKAQCDMLFTKADDATAAIESLKAGLSTTFVGVSKSDGSSTHSSAYGEKILAQATDSSGQQANNTPNGALGTFCAITTAIGALSMLL